MCCAFSLYEHCHNLKKNIICIWKKPSLLKGGLVFLRVKSVCVRQSSQSILLLGSKRKPEIDSYSFFEEMKPAVFRPIQFVSQSYTLICTGVSYCSLCSVMPGDCSLINIFFRLINLLLFFSIPFALWNTFMFLRVLVIRTFLAPRREIKFWFYSTVPKFRF